MVLFDVLRCAAAATLMRHRLIFHVQFSEKAISTVACACAHYKNISYTHMIRDFYTSICLINRLSFAHLLSMHTCEPRYSHSFSSYVRVCLCTIEMIYILKMDWRVVKLFHQIIVIVPCVYQ